MDATLNQQIPANTTIMDSGNVSIGSVGSIPSTETPPPGYMSEDGDPMDQNDNLSELVSKLNKHLFAIHFIRCVQLNHSYRQRNVINSFRFFCKACYAYLPFRH